MKYPIATCSNCKKKFKFKPKIKYNKGIEVVYGQCPECGTRYLSYVTNEEIRQRIVETEKIRQRNKLKPKSEKIEIVNAYIQETRHLMKKCAEENSSLVNRIIQPRTET